MDAGQNKAHAHPYGSTVIPPTATPPVVTVPERTATPQSTIELAIDLIVEQITARVVEQVTAQLAPVIDRMMWAIEVMRVNGAIDKSCDCDPAAHSPEQISSDESFHSRTCPKHPEANTREA